MSESDKKTPIVPSDQGATSMTATVVPKELESAWLQFLKQRKEDKEHDEMVVEYNTMMENIQKRTLYKEDLGPPPNLDKDKHVGVSCHTHKLNPDLHPNVSVLENIGDHVSAIQEAIADNRDGNSTNTIVEGKVEALAKYLGGLPTTEVAAHQIEDSDKKEDKSAAPPLPPSKKDNFAEIEMSLRNQRSWFLKQNEELLKLLDCLHKQEYDEVVQEEEILDRISDFTLVLFEYVKTLKKRKGRGAVCV